MKDKTKYYSQKCFEYILTHTVWYLVTTGISFISLNIPKAISFIFEYENWLLIISTIFSYISVLLLVFLILLLLIAYFKRKKSNTILPNESQPSENHKNKPSEKPTTDSAGLLNINENLLSQIHFKKIVISIKFESCKAIEYTMKYEGFACESNIEFFEKHLSWSETQYLSTTLVSSNIETHIDDNIGNRDHSPYTFRVYFDEDIVVNDKIKFTTKTLLSDETKCMIPLSAFCVKYPIDELVLRLSAPIGLLHTVRKKCYKDHSRHIQLYSSKNIEQEELNGFKTYSYTIPKPESWLYYALEWKFSEQY